ncbi:uncharacterized protein [Sylvia atricapilla]|uniref:uncharacterized protein isoform X2 n=1 Tax=Sylvia atricapilla TaxID=48155 RepID=UPI003399E88B
MKMRLEFLLLVVAAFPSCLSRMGHDSGEDSRQDSHRDSRRSRGRSRDRSPRLLPAPLVLLLPSEPGPPRLRCLAPRRFPGSTFELLPGMPAGMPGLPVRSVLAAPDQHWAEFSLPGTARCWRCRYRNHNGSAWLESELSPVIGSSDLGDVECHLGDPGVTGPPPTAGTLRNDPSWLLPVSLGVAVPGLLLGAAAVAWRGLRRQRERSPTVPAPSFPMASAPTSLSQ